MNSHKQDIGLKIEAANDELMWFKDEAKLIQNGYSSEYTMGDVATKIKDIQEQLETLHYNYNVAI